MAGRKRSTSNTPTKSRKKAKLEEDISGSDVETDDDQSSGDETEFQANQPSKEKSERTIEAMPAGRVTRSGKTSNEDISLPPPPKRKRAVKAKPNGGRKFLDLALELVGEVNMTPFPVIDLSKLMLGGTDSQLSGASRHTTSCAYE